MQPIHTLLSAQYVVPIEPRGKIYHDYSIAIDNGRIVEICATKDAVNTYTPQTHIEYDHHILMPGLINAHTHAAMSLLRGVGSDTPLMQWLQDHIWPIEQQWVDEKFVQDGSELAIAEMLRGGITCFNDMYFFPEVTARVASNIGMRAVIGMILLEFPTIYAASPDEYLAKGLALFDNYKSDPLISNVFAPHAPYTVSDDTFGKLNRYADELDLPVHMHIHETQHEIETSIEEHGVRPLERLDNLGLVNPNLLAVHMTQLEDKEIERVAEAGVNVIHCPQSNLKLASGFCPTYKLLRRDARVVVGTDGCASNDDLNMFSEIKTAALLAKGVSQDATALPAQQALQAITIEAARALGIGDETGSLEVGKSADIIAVACDSVEAQPLSDLHSQLIYSTDRSRVMDVFVAGRQLLRNRTLTTISEDEIIGKANDWGQQMAQGKQ